MWFSWETVRKFFIYVPINSGTYLTIELSFSLTKVKLTSRFNVERYLKWESVQKNEARTLKQNAKFWIWSVRRALKTLICLELS